MAAWKLSPENTMESSPASPLAAIEWTLPADILLEIVALSDARTLVRCTATCKLLRRDILSAPFIHRVSRQGGIVPPSILACINTTYDDTVDPPPPLSLMHPATPAAVSILDDHLSPYLSRFADDLLDEHYPLMSSGGLVLLIHRDAKSYLSNLCVYDLLTGHCTFLSGPPVIEQDNTSRAYRLVLLTAADGIDCSFLLLVAILDSLPQSNACSIQVHTVTSTRGTWAPAVTIHDTSGLSFHEWFARDGIVLHGGVIHWLVHHRGEIFTYNVCTTEQGLIKLPAHIANLEGQVDLGSYYSQDGKKLLRLFRADRFKISMWHQLPCGDWVPKALTIDTEKKLRSLEPDITTGLLVFSLFMCSCEGNIALLLRVFRCISVSGRRFLLSVFNLETKEMRVQEFPTLPFVLLEVDLPSRLRSMKIF